MLFLVYFFFFVLLPYEGFSQISDCGLCPEGFTYFEQQNKCYKAFSTKVNWDEALMNCDQLGSHLVTITSAASNNPLKEVIDPIKASCMNPAVNQPAFWTAGRKKCSNGPFTWVPKRDIKMDMVYTNWLPGEPNNAKGIEDCVHLLAGDRNNMLWNDTPCGSANCFVCEVDL